MDGAKAKIFTRIGRELAMAVKEGGGLDPRSNSKLKDCIAKARAADVSSDNIKRIIKKAADGDDGTKHESIVYEGCGLSGVTVVVEALTGNRNRTAADVCHYFDEFGDNPGTSGCVSFLFSQKGVLMIEREGLSENAVMTDCLGAGAADFQADDDMFEVYTEPGDFSAVLPDLEGKGYEFVSAEVEMVPTTYIALDDPDSITKMQKLLDNLENSDNVRSVWRNWESAGDTE